MNDKSEKEADFGYKKVNPNEKPDLVKGVFDSVANKYDLMNDLMSVGIHRPVSYTHLTLPTIYSV